jgi:tRNA-binding protein
MVAEIIEYSDFSKLDLRVGRVRQVERVPKTEKLYKLLVDIGNEKIIQIVSSLVPYYMEEELLDSTIIVLVNLKQTKFHGELSEGMLLAAETEDGSECVLLTTQKDIALGSKIT